MKAKTMKSLSSKLTRLIVFGTSVTIHLQITCYKLVRLTKFMFGLTLLKDHLMIQNPYLKNSVFLIMMLRQPVVLGFKLNKLSL